MARDRCTGTPPPAAQGRAASGRTAQGRAASDRAAARAIPVLVAATMLLAACGQRGPLYLPDSRPARKPAPAAASGTGDSGQPVRAPVPATRD